MEIGRSCEDPLGVLGGIEDLLLQHSQYSGVIRKIFPSGSACGFIQFIFEGILFYTLVRKNGTIKIVKEDRTSVGTPHGYDLEEMQDIIQNGSFCSLDENSFAKAGRQRNISSPYEDTSGRISSMRQRTAIRAVGQVTERNAPLSPFAYPCYTGIPARPGSPFYEEDEAGRHYGYGRLRR